MAQLIVIEGGDKLGKETQSKMLLETLRASGFSAALAEVPVKSAVTHRLIYWMLKKGFAKRLPNLFQFVQFMNRLGFQLLDLPDLLRENEYVILDRWALSSIVYGDATGVNKRFNRFLYSFMKRPCLTIILDGTKKSQRVDDEYEADTGLQTSVREGYRKWAEEHVIDHEVVSNHGEREEVHARIMCTLLHTDILLGRSSWLNLK